MTDAGPGYYTSAFFIDAEIVEDRSARAFGPKTGFPRREDSGIVGGEKNAVPEEDLNSGTTKRDLHHVPLPRADILGFVSRALAGGDDFAGAIPDAVQNDALLVRVQGQEVVIVWVLITPDDAGRVAVLAAIDAEFDRKVAVFADHLVEEGE